ncbi:hypothetical protein GCM10027176_50890 [Actinoallomurus bryophytorum]|jgi:hypothetical protein|uniref:Uncharacterized protein n=1 Tax=Actinoallomurus bryophytorum TaxID=1490222 RepID=A0A543CHU9_9ACTN|nr:hypothetical protein [Actinoallomurus bryophytorum]TQL96661.1 hypothetical protein FB559_2206 [Actinoallomurus bryophytorum]
MREAGPEDERSFSERLFGSRYRLELLAAFAAAPDGRVNLGVLAEGKGVRAAVYYPAIRDLLAMRLAVRIEQVTRDRRRWYERSGDDSLWESFAAVIGGLQQHFEQIVGADTGRRARHERVRA